MPETDRLPLYSTHLDDLLDRYRNLKQVADAWAKNLDAVKTELVDALRRNELTEYVQNGEKVVQIITTHPSRFDTKAFRRDHPDVARQYEVTSTVERVLIK